jgi:LVIVD repeat
MRVWSRFIVVVALLLAAATGYSDHTQGECPLSLVDTVPAVSDFHLSPHGVFRSGNLVYVLRGNILTTYTTNDTGNLSIAREDYLDIAARETEGGTAFANGFLYVSSEAGLEIFDLTNTRAGGSAPVRRSITPGRHYRRLAVNGNRLAGLFPATDFPCYPQGSFVNPLCVNQIELLDISNPLAPGVVGLIRSNAFSQFRGINDIAFNNGLLMVLSEEGLTAVDISNPAAPTRPGFVPFPGKWLVSNGADVIGVGTDSTINLFVARSMNPYFTRTNLLTLPQYLTIDRSNAIRFSRNAWWDEGNGRLVTMIEEVDPMTLDAARTIAFDVFDVTIPLFEGSAERIYEDVTMLEDDEVKHNPVVVGPFVYVIGEATGLQSYGSCGQITGKIELDSPRHLVCGGATIHGWVTGINKINAVELFLNNTPLGPAKLGGVLRTNVSSKTPVLPWTIKVDLDQTARGEYTLRAIGTDALNRRRQFYSQRLFFEGPGQNCVNIRRRAVR